MAKNVVASKKMTKNPHTKLKMTKNVAPPKKDGKKKMAENITFLLQQPGNQQSINNQSDI